MQPSERWSFRLIVLVTLFGACNVLVGALTPAVYSPAEILFWYGLFLGVMGTVIVGIAVTEVYRNRHL